MVLSRAHDSNPEDFLEAITRFFLGDVSLSIFWYSDESGAVRELVGRELVEEVCASVYTEDLGGRNCSMSELKRCGPGG